MMVIHRVRAILVLASFLGATTGSLMYPLVQSLNTSIAGRKSAARALNYLILSVGSEPWLMQVAQTVQFDFEFSGQINPTLKKTTSHNVPKTRGALQKLFHEGTIACCVLKPCAEAAQTREVAAQLIDTCTGDVLCEVTSKNNTGNLVAIGHNIADSILKAVSGDSIAKSKLAYCELRGPKHKVIMVSDYACKAPREVVSAPTINVMPTWHPTRSGLFYCQFTPTNNRLMVYNGKKKTHDVICSLRGLNMQPSFSPDGAQVVLCLSAKGNTELYLFDASESTQHHKRAYKQLTHNGGTNTSPVMLSDGNILFCSDFETKTPQIYLLDRKTNTTKRLTQGGYCVAPTYCSSTKTIGFTKLINDTFQICTMQLHENGTISHCRQITQGGASKLSPTWAPGGKFLAFVYNCSSKDGRSCDQIGVVHAKTGKVRQLTVGGFPKSFPAWQ